VEDLFAWSGLPDVDRVIVTVSSAAEARARGLVERLRVLPNRVILLLDLERLSLGADRVGALDDSPAALLANHPNDARRAILKRIQDLVLGGFIFAVALIPMLLIALAVRLDSPGQALFRQLRHGFNNRVITVLKFRSMRSEAADPLAARQVQKDDDRVTRVGRFLRRTSLDELPQLINVLKGEMSLVGPRPHAVGMRTGDVESRLLVAEYAHRHRMKPGMTGWAQINGSRGPLHSAEEVRERIRLDLEYVDRASFWFDLWIILKTVPALLGDTQKIR
jgi:exopolysaccharide biosynthesis polyprenyl glycosylphosphotransferase